MYDYFQSGRGRWIVLIVAQSNYAPWVAMTAPSVDIMTAVYKLTPHEFTGTSFGKSTTSLRRTYLHRSHPTQLFHRLPVWRQSSPPKVIMAPSRDRGKLASKN